MTCRETGVALALALGEQLQGLGDDPAVELLDHPRALRRLDEGGGRQQLAVVAGHPQQQLVALDPARGEAADRLGVKAEPVVGERVADPRRRRLAALVLALRLAGVAGRGRSGCARPPWPGTSPGRRRPGPPRRRSSRSPPNIVIPTLIVAGSASGAGRGVLGDLGAQVLAELQGALGVGLRHQHRELVAGEAGDDVGGRAPVRA